MSGESLTHSRIASPIRGDGADAGDGADEDGQERHLHDAEVDEVLAPLAEAEDPRAPAVADSEVDRLLKFVGLRRLDHQAFPTIRLEVLSSTPAADAAGVGDRIIVATGFDEEGLPEPLGYTVGRPDDETVWSLFLASLVVRGLSDVDVVVYPPYPGVKQVIETTLPAAVALPTLADVEELRPPVDLTDLGTELLWEVFDEDGGGWVPGGSN